MEAQPSPIELTLRTIARLENAAFCERRLTDPSLAAWERFRRKLGLGAFIEILHEDLAGAFPVPFDLERWDPATIGSLGDDRARALVTSAAVSAAESPDTAAFLRECARALGLPSGGALSDLPRVQPQNRVLELPGGGGRLAASLCGSDPNLRFHRQFTFVADSDAERIAIGIAAVELRADEPRIFTTGELAARLDRGDVFDRVLGLRESARAVELAARFFPEAKLV
jgi:hypothetical protein